MPTAPILTPCVAQLVDDLLDRAEHGSERDDDDLRVGGAIRRTSPPELRPKACENSPASSGITSSACICFACIRYLTSVNASGPTIAPIVDRVGGVEHLARLEGRKEGVDLLLGRAGRPARRRA